MPKPQHYTPQVNYELNCGRTAPQIFTQAGWNVEHKRNTHVIEIRFRCDGSRGGLRVQQVHEWPFGILLKKPALILTWWVREKNEIPPPPPELNGLTKHSDGKASVSLSSSRVAHHSSARRYRSEYLWGKLWREKRRMIIQTAFSAPRKEARIQFLCVPNSANSQIPQDLFLHRLFFCEWYDNHLRSKNRPQ